MKLCGRGGGGDVLALDSPLLNPDVGPLSSFASPRIAQRGNLVGPVRHFMLIGLFSNGERFGNGVLVNTCHFLKRLSDGPLWQGGLLGVKQPSLRQCHVTALRGILLFHR